jgi:dTDP-4-dehydrorhamnose reductase
VPGRLIIPTPADALGWIAERPRYSALGSERGLLLPPVGDALERYARALEREALIAA